MLIYLLIGIVGVPVFSGMKGGIGVLFAPTGGYITGFLACAYISGLLLEKTNKPFLSCIYLSTAGTIPQEPQVGAVTMMPQSAFCSLTAKA